MDRRQHLIVSLEGVLYQLNVLSFFFSPTFLPFLIRIVAQSHCKPRHDDSRSLKFYFFLIFFFNTPSLWFHSTHSSRDDRALILDFVGLAYIPSRIHLLSLDAFIILIHALLATIAYETALSPEHDILRPLDTKDSHSQYVIDVRFKPLISRLRNPPPVRPSSSLPLPNTTPWAVTLLRASRRIRTERRIPGALDTNT